MHRKAHQPRPVGDDRRAEKADQRTAGKRKGAELKGQPGALQKLIEVFPDNAELEPVVHSLPLAGQPCSIPRRRVPAGDGDGSGQKYGLGSTFTSIGAP